ncbi:MAG: Ig-like domain-containing protein, partial [Thermoanaerobaculia bacterium]|nr:Ig-like domain-containing protein [Thermoanaerobaculia bacterium]
MSQLRRLFAVLILIVAVNEVAEADGRMIVPVVGSAAGVNGANFRTEMQLHNPGNGVMRGTLMFLPQAPTPQAGGLATLGYEIGPKETIRFADVVASMGASGLGSLDVLPFEGGRPRIVARAFDDQGNFGTRGLMVPVLDESEAPVLGFRFALLAPADIARYRFNIGVRTLGESSTMLRVVEHDAAGATVGEPITLEFPGESFRQQPAAMLLGRELAAGHTYSFETLSGEAFVYATTVDNQTNDGALQLDRPVNRPPVVAGATVTTDVNEPVTIAIQATDPDDDPMTFRITAGPSHGTLSDLPVVTKALLASEVSVIYTPATDYQGPDMFTILVSDDVNGRTFANILINVGTQAGTAPTAVNDRYTMDEGATLTIAAPGVLSNDTDPEGNALVAQLVRGPVSAATFTLSADGSFTYRPRVDFSGGDFFQYQASDGANVSNVARVVIIVNSLNDPPTAFADAASTTEDAAVAINVLTNDTDPESDPLTVVSVSSAGTLGAVTLGAGGVVNYDPTGSAVLQALAAAATRTDTFTYTIRDTSGETSTAMVTVTVTGVDDLPTAVADAATLLEDAGATAIPVLTNDTDPDGGTTAITGVTQGGNGAAVITGGGTGVTYQPNPGFCGTDSFTYTITGGATATVTITVTCVNDAPSFTAGAGPTVLEDSGPSTSSGWATAISRGPSPTEDGQTLTFNVTNNTNPTLFSSGPAIDPATGNLTFTPAANANGSADITVTLSDNGGTANGGVDTSAPQMFTIDVTAVNDEPSFTKGADETVLEETGAHSVSGWATALSAGPADESAQVLAFTLTNDNNALFSVQPAMDASGNLTYTLAANASGSTVVTVSLSDDGGTANGGDDTAPDQTFTITVTDINDAPSFTGGADESVNEDSGTAGAHTVAGWATAISAGPSPFEDAQTLDFVIDTNDNPSLFSVAPAIDAAGTLTYTLAANAFGTATITLHLHDSGGVLNGGVDESTGDTLVINVASQNDNPTAADDSASVAEDSGATGIDVLANDDDAPDTGETLSITGVTQGTNGGAVVITGGGTGLTYQPASNFAGTDTFTYTIGDGNLGSATATVTMTVTAVNDAPVNSVPGAQSVDQLMTLVFSSGNGNAISIFDQDAATPQVTVAVDNGAVSLSGTTGLSFSSGDGTGDATMTFTGLQADINTALGGLVYDPVDTFEGAATLTITTNDLGQTGTGGALQDVDVVTVNVTALNDPPANSLPAAQATAEDTTLTLSTGNANRISISDPDAGGADVQVTLTATNGTMTLGGTTGLVFTTGDGTADATMTFTGTIGDINTALDGLQFVPTAAFSGAASIQIVTDDLGNTGAGGAQSDTDTLAISVNAVNNAPVNTVPGAQTIDEDVTLTFAGTISVADDAGTNPVRVTLTVTQGTLSLASTSGLTPVAGADGSASMTFDGTLTDVNNALNGLDYTPAANYFGSDTLTLTTNDLGNTGSGGPLSDTDTVGITINSLNDAPTDIQLSNSAIDENQVSGTAVGSLTTTDADVADTHTYTLVAGTGDTDNASFQIVGGQLQTAAILDFETQSSYSVRIRTTDNGTGGLFYEEVFTITLNNVNENPTDIALSNASVQENQASGTAVGNLSTTDPDAGDTFSYTLVAGTGSADNGSFQIAGGQLQTAASFDFETKSSYSIRVRSTDLGGLFFEKQFTISIANQNETPTDITLTDQSIDENSGVNAVVGTLSTTDPDAGDTFTYTLVAGTGSTDNALFNIAGNSLRENASFNFEAQSSYSIRVRSTDAAGLFVEEAFTIAIVNVPEAPVAGDDAFDTIGNTLLEVDAASSEPQPKVYFSGTLLTGDVDPDTGTNAGLTTMLLAATPGAVVTVNPDGTFKYLPPAGHVGATDTFTYTLSDGALSDTGLVTITLLGRVWYVDPNVAGGGDGRSTAPLNTLNSLDGAGGAGDSDLTGDYIFVHDGTLALAGPMEMEANQHLVGEGVGLSLPVNPNGTGSPWVGLAAGAQPQVTNATGDAVTITAAIPVEIVGLSLASTTGNAIDLTSGVAL